MNEYPKLKGLINLDCIPESFGWQKLIMKVMFC